MSKIIQARRVKDFRRHRRGNPTPASEKQKAVARERLLRDNPMKNPEIAKKLSKKLKGRITSPNNLFKKGNQFGKLRKNTKISERQKAIIGLKNFGKKNSEKQKAVARERLLKDNPMKNPKIVEKNKLSKKINRKVRGNQRRRIASLNNPNVKSTWFQPKVLITSTLVDKIINLYVNKKYTLERLQREIGLNRATIKKILIKSGIQIDLKRRYKQ